MEVDHLEIGQPRDLICKESGLSLWRAMSVFIEAILSEWEFYLCSSSQARMQTDLVDLV